MRNSARLVLAGIRLRKGITSLSRALTTGVRTWTDNTLLDNHTSLGIAANTGTPRSHLARTRLRKARAPVPTRLNLGEPRAWLAPSSRSAYDAITQSLRGLACLRSRPSHFHKDRKTSNTYGIASDILGRSLVYILHVVKGQKSVPA